MKIEAESIRAKKPKYSEQLTARAWLEQWLAIDDEIAKATSHRACWSEPRT